MDKPPDNRKDTRFKTRFDALYASGEVEGHEGASSVCLCWDAEI